LIFQLCFPIGKHPTIESNVFLTRSHGLFGKIQIGDNVFFGRDVKIDYSGKIVIEDDVWISEGAWIYSHKHELNLNRTNKHLSQIEGTELTLRKKCWVGARSIILESVNEIGENAVIGAGSIVTKNVPPNTVVAGNPAKVVRYIES
jgi:acetyltransferase-like isoleucine patch superfamily enzyme